MASTYLTRTPSGAGTSNKIFTQSVWVKRSSTGHHAISGSGDSNGYNQVFVEFNNSHALRIAQINGAGEAFTFEYVTNRLFRDFNGWYHIVLTADSTESTEADRIKIYVNGVRETSFSTTNHPSLNAVFKWNDARVHSIGREGAWNARLFDGCMSHFHNIDGTAYQASTFGSTDATTGEWKINTSPSVTYGTNGFFILKDGNSVTDQSGNSNNFTVGGGTLTKTEDCPSNVFATMNALDNGWFDGTFSNGNNTVVTNASKENYFTSTLGASSGKYYWEVKISASGSNKDFIGIADKVSNNNDFTPYSGNNKMRSYYGSTGVSVIGSTGTAFGATFGAGDIIGVAMDLDNHKIYYSKNGVFQGSGNPSTGANGLDIDTSPASGFYYAQGANIHNTSSTYQTNFGNGYFGTTAVSSAGTNASGIGIFEYDVPTGFTALSTKGLNL
jgi:hypothetical protein